MDAKRPGLTKKELLVALVFTVILVLVISPPGCLYPRDVLRARASKSLQHARQLGLALRQYVEDYGALPTGENANQALARLVPEIQSERIFFVGGSAWHGSGRFHDGPDELWESTTPAGIALAPGENAWAYNRLATMEASETRIPLLASAFSEIIGTYSEDPARLGGVWKGKFCLVLYTDGSAETARLDETLQFTLDGANVFAQSPSVDMVNPAPPVD